MRISHRAIITVLLFLSYTSLFAGIRDKVMLDNNLNKKTYDIDTSAGAIILFQQAKIRIEKRKEGYVQIYTVLKDIKILKTTGFALATVKEVYPNAHNNSVKVSKVTGTTYSIENGEVKQAHIEQQEIQDNKISKDYNELTFTMPGIKSGAIIEYSYEIEGPLNTILPSWEFKGRNPILNCIYSITAPKEVYIHKIGNSWLKTNQETGKAAVEKNNRVNYSSSDEGETRTQSWKRDSIPALKPEPFASSPDNYAEVLQLAVGTKDYEKEVQGYWYDLNGELWTNAYLGKVATANDSRAQAVVDSLTTNEKTPLAKAKAIFTYVRQNFDNNGNEGIYARRSFDQVFGKRDASEAEINLIMVAMMRMAKLNASPVILSKLNTRIASPFVAVASQFNYTVGVVTIDTTRYFLDGSNFFNAFGALPIYCYTGYARIIDERGSPAQLSYGDYKDKNIQLVKITGITDSFFVAEVTDRKGKIEASYLRNIIGGRDTTILEKYVRKRSQPFGANIKIISSEAENLFEPDNDLIFKYTIKVQRPDKNKLDINTNIMKFFPSSPFTAKERLLPVEFPTKYLFSYTMNIQVPSSMDYTVSATPTMGDVNLIGLETAHDISYNKDSRVLSIKTTLNIDRTSFPAEEYPSVKYFFEQMIGQENAVITLKNK